MSKKIYTLAQAQAIFTEANKIYKIKNDINLATGTLTLPSGCTLDFQGGVISNGTLVGDQSRIKASEVQIFGNDLTISGTWIGDKISAEWCGAIPNSTSSDCSSAINKALSFRLANASLTTNIPCVLMAGRYYVQSSILLDGGKSLRGEGTNKSLLNGKGNGTFPIVKITGGSNILSDVAIWGHDASGTYTRNGVELGESDYSISATRGVVSNISFRLCNICLAAYNQWCNKIDGIRTAKSNKGVYALKTQLALSDSCIEDCALVGIESNGLSILSVFGSVIEGNYCGIIFEGSVCDIRDCYFESNSESSVNENAQKTSQGIDVNGGHILVGRTSYAESLSINGCFFSNGTADNNDIYVDKCYSLYVDSAPSMISVLHVTDNTNINSLNTKNAINQLYNPSTVTRKSNVPFFAKSDFSDMEQSSGNLIREIDRYYFSVYGNAALIRKYNGTIESYRTTEKSDKVRWLQVYFGKPVFEGHGRFTMVVDFSIHNPNVRPNVSIKYNDGSTQTLKSWTMPRYNYTGRMQRIVAPLYLYGLTDLSNVNYLWVEIWLVADTDTFVSEADDLSDANKFAIYGAYLYDGDTYDYNGNNVFPNYGRLASNRFVANSGVVFKPLLSVPDKLEEGMTIYNDQVNKLSFYNGSAWVETGDANVIESISINNTAQTITNKNVNLTVPTSADITTIVKTTQSAYNSLATKDSSTLYLITS